MGSAAAARFVLSSAGVSSLSFDKHQPLEYPRLQSKPLRFVQIVYLADIASFVAESGKIASDETAQQADRL